MEEEQKPSEQTEQAEAPQQPNPTEVTTDNGDEQVPIDDAGEVIAPGSEPKKPKDFKPPKKKKNFKKFFLWLFILLLLLGIAGAVYWYFFKKSSAPATTTQTSSNTTQQKEEPMTYEPVNVAYAYRDKAADPFVIYYRPATGGKRVTVTTLGKTDVISYTDSFARNVAYVANENIYVSVDGGVSYKKVFDSDPGAQITSVKFSRDGKKLAFGYLKDAGNKGVVKSIDLDGGNSKDLFTATTSGVFIVSWNDTKQKIIYQEGCYNCDGSPGFPKVMDMKTDKSTDLVTATDGKAVAAIAASESQSKVILVKSTINNGAEGIGGLYAPFEVLSIDVAKAKTTVITTIGTKDEKNANGTLKTRQFNVGFVAGSDTPYYSSDNQIFAYKGTSTSLVYQSSKVVLYLPFVSDTIVISGSGKDTSDYSLDNYNINTKKTSNIFSGDDNTIIFGVTTK